MVQIRFDNRQVRVPAMISGKELKKLLQVNKLRVRVGNICREVQDADKLNFRQGNGKLTVEEISWPGSRQ